MIEETKIDMDSKINVFKRSIQCLNLIHLLITFDIESQSSDYEIIIDTDYKIRHKSMIKSFLITE